MLIPYEVERPLDVAAPPDETTIAVTNVAELQAGVPAATDTATRARRSATLQSVSGAGAGSR